MGCLLVPSGPGCYDAPARPGLYLPGVIEPPRRGRAIGSAVRTKREWCAGAHANEGTNR